MPRSYTGGSSLYVCGPSITLGLGCPVALVTCVCGLVVVWSCLSSQFVPSCLRVLSPLLSHRERALLSDCPSLVVTCVPCEALPRLYTGGSSLYVCGPSITLGHGCPVSLVTCVCGLVVVWPCLSSQFVPSCLRVLSPLLSHRERALLSDCPSLVTTCVPCVALPRLCTGGSSLYVCDPSITFGPGCLVSLVTCVCGLVVVWPCLSSQFVPSCLRVRSVVVSS